jgi:hypothetical protein
MAATSQSIAPTAPIRVPKTIGEIDADWLTKALSSRAPAFAVERAQVRENLGGACSKLRVAVHTNCPDFPASIIVKGCFEAHNQTTVPWLQRLESNLYNRLVPYLNDVETVKCFFAQGDELNGSVLILEDLDTRGVRCLRAQEPIAEFDVAARFIDSLAKLHAKWWNGPELADRGLFGWLPGPSDAKLLFEFRESTLSDEIQMADILGRPRAAAIPARLHDRGRLLQACRVMMDYVRHEPRVLAHGDPHLANLFLTADGQPGFLDWTSLRVPWVFDVAYFIVGCLDVCDRRRWEGPLLEHYLSRLSTLGVEPPGFNEAWWDYRCWAIYGLLGWLINRTDYHSEASITAMASRYGAAVAEHDSLGLIGV